ncbi:serine/threonine protein phosphatase PrpC [Mucilaginibacter frigoritolerans]|uniref:Serine/threonine protein phosphatase PrpC n=1 Tax=Mucilaginibacter frigoritolerans TaxID=652788 RepID=A0A562TN69_9SPHI|nr:protein phosphatase 2C domain-containing protein [Mucilaginibacter frigoritolerans]TWI95031.1 serine/threonine protein phosphatase PrpC [Mucilaginibacter frigoritolerans]
MSDNIFGITDTGRQRKNNEDAFIAEQSPDGRYIIACVIDGVGGYTGGEIAASIAREMILQRLVNLSGEVIPVLTGAFAEANEKIWEERHVVKEHSKMACVVTLAVVDLSSNQCYYAHLGDTRLYLFRDGSLVKISHDQSFVGFLEDSGRLSESEAMNHPKRNEIDKALGFQVNIINGDEIETGQSPFLPGDMLLLCSDGLTDVVNKATITATMTGGSSLKTIGNKLIDAANNEGGKDNITVVLVKNDKEKQQHAATKPLENAQPEKPKIITGQRRHTPTTSAIAERAPRKSYKGWAILLLVLVIGLAAVCLWQYVNYGNKQENDVSPKKDSVANVPRQRNPQEIKLQKVIDQNKGKILVLSDTAFKSPVIISQSILIGRDSLYIKAKGNITFQSDTGFKHPAFVLASHTKIVQFDSVSFQSFNVAISGHDQALQLKNVRFRDCKIPVLNTYAFPGKKYISGGFNTPAFRADSIPKTK